MKAIVQERYGADALELRDIDVPSIDDDEVLVRVRAAGMDPGVWHLVTGLPYLVRMSGYGLRAPKTPVPGSDFAGVVEAIGASVSEVQPGDEVFGTGSGSFAEYIAVDASRLAPKPPNVSFEAAAAVPTSGTAALQGLRDKGHVSHNQSVLIIGAGGGVGICAVQITKSMGARATGVCSTNKVELVRSIGADDVIDYTQRDFADGPELFDVILDTAGNRPLRRLRRALTPRGSLVIVGGEGGGRWLGGTQRQALAVMMSSVVRHRLAVFIAKPTAKDLAVLGDLMASEQLRPVIERTYDLTEAFYAVREPNKHARGKVVVLP